MEDKMASAAAPAALLPKHRVNPTAPQRAGRGGEGDG